MSTHYTRITGCTGTGESLTLSLDYGELNVTPELITHAFAVKIKDQDGYEIPTILLSVEGQEGFYYIDGVKITQQLFRLDGRVGKPEEGSYSSSRTTDLVERKFVLFARGLCDFLTSTYVDKPLLECIEGSIFFLPTFNSRKDAIQYCAKVIDEAAREGKKESQDLSVRHDDLTKLSAPDTEREEWTEGTILEGKYTVQEVFKGGMGIVYIVFDSENVRFYAMKTFQERYLWNESVIRQFIKEAEIWINLEKHPNIVNAELVKVIEGKPYIFLEYVQGEILDNLIKQELLPVRKSIELAIQFCEGMHYAYKKLGLIHRDIKPSNCFLTRNGVLKISDFGLGKIFDDGPEGGELISLARKSVGKKSTGTSSTTVVGTLPFMAPELFQSIKKSGVRSDIYSFGILLYMILTGINPFHSDDPAEIIVMHATLKPKSPEQLNSDIPLSLSGLVLRCIHKEPEQRFESFALIQEELQKIYEESYGVRYQLDESKDSFSEEDWVNKGVSLASLSRHREALITYEQALSLNPESVRGLIQKGISLLRLDRAQEALECFEKASEISPEHWEPFYWRGEALWKQEKREKALESFDLALGFSPARPEILGSKGRLLNEMGKSTEALQCFDEALSHNSKLEQIWDAKGITLHSLYRFEDASHCFLRAIEINPRYHQAWSHRGHALKRLGFFADAINTYQKALTMNPDSIEERIGIGKCFKELKNLQRAQLSFDQGLRIRKNNEDLIAAKALLMDEMGYTEDAIGILGRSLQLSPESRKTGTVLAKLLLKLGYFEKALRILQGLEPCEGGEDEPSRLRQFAEFKISEKNSLLSGIMKYDPISRESVHKNLSMLLSVFCNVVDALGYMKHMTAIKEEAHSLFLLAQLQMIRGELNDALASTEKVLGLAGDFPQAMALKESIQKEIQPGKEKEKKKGLIQSLLKRGEEKESIPEDWMLLPKGLEELEKGNDRNALQHLQLAIEREPDSHACLFFAAVALKHLGDNDKAENLFADFIGKFPQSPGYYRYRILTAPADTEYALMEELFQKWIGFFPVDHQPWLSYVRHLLIHNRRESARLVATAISEIFSNYWIIPKKTSEYWNLRGLLELYLGRYVRAYRFFSKGLSYSPGNPLSMLGLGKCHEKKGFDEEALKHYEKVMETSVLTGMYEKANVEMKRKKKDEALKSIDRAIEKNQSSLLLNFKKAQIYVEFDDFRSFFNYYSTIYHPDIQFSPLYLLRARSLVNTDMLNEAISYIGGALTGEPNNIPYLKSLGFLNLRANNPERAISYFERCIGLYHLDGESHLGKAICSYLLHRYQPALDAFRHYLKLSPLDLCTLLFLGATHFQLQDLNAAERHFQAALDFDDNNASTWTDLGVFYSRNEKYGEALQFVERALRIDRENVYAWLCRGKSKKVLGYLDEAYRSVEQALFYAPQNIHGWLLRGQIEFELGNHKESLESFIKACEIVEKNPLIWYHRGVMALHANEHHEANKSFTRTLTLDPALGLGWAGRAVYYMLQGDGQMLDHALTQMEAHEVTQPGLTKSHILSSEDPRSLLGVFEVLPIPFDLPIPYLIETTEPLSPLSYDALERNF